MGGGHVAAVAAFATSSATVTPSTVACSPAVVVVGHPFKSTDTSSKSTKHKTTCPCAKQDAVTFCNTWGLEFSKNDYGKQNVGVEEFRFVFAPFARGLHTVFLLSICTVECKVVQQRSLGRGALCFLSNE
jgi:hypothetical protein